ncbi:MAG: hydrolase [Planctomycetota bacterium]|nr:MAG: hydrolase [Planctomycetota bacterium]
MSVIYIDVDNTLITTYLKKRTPINHISDNISDLSKKGHLLYCWSTGGAIYAKDIAIELGIEKYFEAFLPKPEVMIDDQPINTWKLLKQIKPDQFSLDDF